MLSFPALLSKIFLGRLETFEKDLKFCDVISKIYCNMNMTFQFPLLFFLVKVFENHQKCLI